MQPEKTESEKIHSLYGELLLSIIPWLCFMLSFLSAGVMAYFVPVTIRTVIDFRSPVFFGWVSIHLYIALAVGTACGFWAKRRAQNILSTAVEKFGGDERFVAGCFREVFMNSIKFSVELTIILTMGCVFTASLILRLCKEITWLDFTVIFLICLGIVSIPTILILTARKKS